MVKKLLKKAVPGLAGLIFALSGCNSDSKIKPFVEPMLGFQTTINRLEISGVPADLRYVPIHPEDTYAKEENNGVIEDDSVKLRRLKELNLARAGVESKLGSSRLDVYWKGSYKMEGEEFTHEDVNIRNYTNNPGTDARGYGAALTYWGADYSDDFMHSFNADLRFSADKEGGFLVGVGFKKYGLDINQGWDRWNDLEEWKSTKVGDISETSVYVGFENRGVGKEEGWFGHLLFGANFYSIDSDEGAKLEDKTAFFAGLGGGFRF
jgi:hypothetical protein